MNIIPVEIFHNIFLYLDNVTSYKLVNKLFYSNITHLFNHYKKLFSNISEKWRDYIDFLIKTLFDRGNKEAVIFLLYNYKDFRIKKIIVKYASINGDVDFANFVINYEIDFYEKNCDLNKINEEKIIPKECRRLYYFMIKFLAKGRHIDKFEKVFNETSKKDILKCFDISDLYNCALKYNYDKKDKIIRIFEKEKYLNKTYIETLCEVGDTVSIINLVLSHTINIKLSELSRFIGKSCNIVLIDWYVKYFNLDNDSVQFILSGVARKGNTQLFDMLIKEHRIDILQSEGYGEILENAVKSGSLDLIKYIINITNEEYLNFIMEHAIDNRKYNIIYYIFDTYKTNLSLLRKFSLDFVRLGSIYLVDYLIEKKLFNGSIQEIAKIAAKYRNLELVKHLYYKYNIDLQKLECETPLYGALDILVYIKENHKLSLKKIHDYIAIENPYILLYVIKNGKSSYKIDNGNIYYINKEENAVFKYDWEYRYATYDYLL